jgi:hypothetical protein
MIYKLAGVPYTSENLVEVIDPFYMCISSIHNFVNIYWEILFNAMLGIELKVSAYVLELRVLVVF